MRFIGQVELPENEVTRTQLTWDVRIYFFWLPTEDGDDCFKIVEQQTGEQTIEEHYRDEGLS